MMNDFAVGLVHDIRRGRDPLHPDRRYALQQAFPVKLDEYIQVDCDAGGTHLICWGYVHVGTDPDKRIAVLAWVKDDYNGNVDSGWEQFGTQVKFDIQGFHSRPYRWYVKAVRRILFYYDTLKTL